MDFVVVGFGLGALGVLLGYALRGFGARWRRRVVGFGSPEIARRSRRGRWCRGGGALLTVGGGGLWFVTVVALLVPASDSLGNLLVGGALALGVIGGAAWAVMFARLQPPLPAVPEPMPGPVERPRSTARSRHRRPRPSADEAAEVGVAPAQALLDPSPLPTNGRSSVTATVELRSPALDEAEPATSEPSARSDQSANPEDDLLSAPVNRTA